MAVYTTFLGVTSDAPSTPTVMVVDISAVLAGVTLATVTQVDVELEVLRDPTGGAGRQPLWVVVTKDDGTPTASTWSDDSVAVPGSELESGTAYGLGAVLPSTAEGVFVADGVVTVTAVPDSPTALAGPDSTVEAIFAVAPSTTLGTTVADPTARGIVRRVTITYTGTGTPPTPVEDPGGDPGGGGGGSTPAAALRGTVDLLDENEGLLVENLAIASAAYSEERNDAGAASIDIADNAPGALSIYEGSLLRFNIGGTPDFTALVEKIRDPQITEDPGKRILKVTGRDWMALLDDAPTEPPCGIGNKPPATTVVFDHSHPLVDRSGYITGTAIGDVWEADVDVLDDPTDGSPAGKDGLTPEAYTDQYADWNWSRAVDGSFNHPLGKVYAYRPFALGAETPITIVWTVDEYGKLSFDNVLVDAGNRPPALMWPTARIFSTIAGAGQHHLCFELENTAWGTGTYNPGGLACTVYQGVKLTPENVLFRTGPNPEGAYPLLGGGWYWADYPATPPGFTVTGAARLLLEDAQTTGHLPGWSLGCTDTTFTSGAPVAKTDELTGRTTDSLLATYQAWAALGYMDLSVRHAEKIIDLWPPHGRPAGSRSWTADDLASLTVERRR